MVIPEWPEAPGSAGLQAFTPDPDPKTGEHVVALLLQLHLVTKEINYGKEIRRDCLHRNLEGRAT
jgi:hypothetical protein